MLVGPTLDRHDEVLDRWGFPIRNVVLLGRLREPGKKSANRERRLQRGLGSFVDRKMLPGLRRLCAEVQPGERVSRTRIADACGVHRETVRNIERAALKKLRAKLGAQFKTGNSLHALRRAIHTLSLHAHRD